MQIKYKITPQEFYEMRKSVNWKDIKLEQLDKALKYTMIVIGVYEENKIVAMGRLVGDYTCRGLLTDIIVKPEYQKKGYGKVVVTNIIEKCKKNLNANDKLCIEASPTAGNRDFYINCGLKYKPQVQDGVYIWLENP